VPTYRDEAVVLRTQQLGEADRIITALTRHHGKVRAVARGVRRTSSRFGARVEPFSHVDVQFALGRGSLDVVTQVESLHSFEFGLDYATFTAAEVLVETADRLVTEEKEPAVRQFRLLLGALLVLDRGTTDGPRPPGMVVDSYLLRALAIAGYAISLAQCAACGSTERLGWFAPLSGGVVCDRCRPTPSAAIDERLRAYLGHLLAGDWVPTAEADASLMRRASGLVSAYATWQLDRNLRSLPFLER